jgi:hypothetical protein
MSYWATALIACVVTAALGLLLTHAEELREGRWLKLVVSIPPVLVISSAFHELSAINAYFGAFSFGILGFIWKSPIAHYGSLAFLRMLHGDMNRPTGIRAEFGAAKRLHIHGDLDDALKHTKQELEKEPCSYEGLLLLAQIYIDVDKPKCALETLDLLLARTPLSAEQRTAVTASRQALESSLLVAK